MPTISQLVSQGREKVRYKTKSPALQSSPQKRGGDVGKVNTAAQKVLQDIITKHGAVIFNGDNYTPEWHTEAEKRGLPNLKTCIEALPVLAKLQPYLPQIEYVEWERCGHYPWREKHARGEFFSKLREWLWAQLADGGARSAG